MTAVVGLAEKKHLEPCQSLGSETERSASTLKTTHAIGKRCSMRYLRPSSTFGGRKEKKKEIKVLK